MRVGVIGTGRIGVVHARLLAAHPDVTELVLYDADLSRAGEVALSVGGAVVGTVEALLDGSPDAVVIAAATSAHAELIKAGCDAGVPVFCEKPVALDAGATRDVLEYVKASGVTVQIGFQRRFDKGYSACRKALHDGELGELRRAHLVSADPAPPAAAYIATSGGIYRDLHIHDFDILRWVTGREVSEVYAVGANRGADFFREADDVDESALLMVLDDGTLATMQGSRYNGAGYDIRMEVVGTRATHVVGLSERSPLRSSEPEVDFPSGPAWQHFYDRFSHAYTEELNVFLEVAVGRHDNPCTVADALEAFYLADAAELSRREHRPVRVTEVVSA